MYKRQPYEGDDSWVENELMAMKQHLDGWQVPAAADDCEHCKYFAERTRIAEEVGDTVAPLCEHCQKPMTAIIYGLPDPGFYEENQATRVFGGCLVGPENPTWACKACGTNAY